ncbi:MAG: hypothetical protein WBY44_28760 [Bryobacteraceae bacterium]
MNSREFRQRIAELVARQKRAAYEGPSEEPAPVTKKPPAKEAAKELVDRNHRPAFDFTAPQFIDTDIALLFPNGEDALSIPVHYGDGPSRNLSRGEISGLIGGNSFIMIYAQVTYQDPFGQHWTRFCAWEKFNTATIFRNADDCVSYNTVGDGDPRPMAPLK